jgi:hypothetical protein
MRFYFLSFIFKYFSESGLFNALQPIQIKKSSRARKTRPGCKTSRARPQRVVGAGGRRRGEPNSSSATIIA